MLNITPSSPVRPAGAQWLGPSAPIRLAQADSATAELQDAVAEIAQQFLALSDRLETEAELGLNPERFTEVPGIGEAFMQAQVVATIGNVAERMSGLILGVLQPPLGAYATSATTEILSEVDARMKAIQQAVATAVGPLADDTVAGADIALSEAYIDSYLDAVSEVIIAIEKLVVIEENGNVDVYEPDEKNGASDLFVVAGITAIVVLLVAVS